MQALATSPRTNGTRRHEPGEAALAQYADGSILALSLSVPGVVYAVTLDPLGCACPGFTYRGACYHVAAAVERFGEPEPAPALPRICGNCGTVVNTSVDIPPYGTLPGRPGCVAWWRCGDLAACVARRDAARGGA